MSYSDFVRGALITAEKDMKIYYKKPPVIIFGLLFPFLMFLAFYMGRELDLAVFFPGFLAMSLFFTSSSVGPLVTPWERQAGTHERLLSYPVNIKVVLFGDILAGSIFGILLSSVVLIACWIFLPIQIINLAFIILSMILGAITFSTLGVLLSAPATKSPSSIMMLSSLVRFPLIFISGIFILLGDMGSPMRYLAYISPLTYLVDSFHVGIGGKNFFGAGIGLIVLIIFSTLFFVLALNIHKRNMVKGL
ncbi:MAG: ABC transporter permease [Candidatus Thermoplasmatota archaeon]